jgi:hypothetical protein
MGSYTTPSIPHLQIWRYLVNAVSRRAGQVENRDSPSSESTPCLLDGGDQLMRRLYNSHWFSDLSADNLSMLPVKAHRGMVL